MCFYKIAHLTRLMVWLKRAANRRTSFEGPRLVILALALLSGAFVGCVGPENPQPQDRTRYGLGDDIDMAAAERPPQSEFIEGATELDQVRSLVHVWISQVSESCNLSDTYKARVEEATAALNLRLAIVYLIGDCDDVDLARRLAGEAKETNTENETLQALRGAAEVNRTAANHALSNASFGPTLAHVELLGSLMSVHRDHELSMEAVDLYMDAYQAEGREVLLTNAYLRVIVLNRASTQIPALLESWPVGPECRLDGRPQLLRTIAGYQDIIDQSIPAYRSSGFPADSVTTFDGQYEKITAPNVKLAAERGWDALLIRMYLALSWEAAFFDHYDSATLPTREEAWHMTNASMAVRPNIISNELVTSWQSSLASVRDWEDNPYYAAASYALLDVDWPVLDRVACS